MITNVLCDIERCGRVVDYESDYTGARRVRWVRYEWFTGMCGMCTLLLPAGDHVLLCVRIGDRSRLSLDVQNMGVRRVVCVPN